MCVRRSHLCRCIASRLESASGYRGLDDEIPGDEIPDEVHALPAADRRIQPDRRHDRDAGIGERRQVALVHVPTQDRRSVHEACHRRHVVGPLQEGGWMVKVVPGAVGDDEVDDSEGSVRH